MVLLLWWILLRGARNVLKWSFLERNQNKTRVFGKLRERVVGSTPPSFYEAAPKGLFRPPFSICKTNKKLPQTVRPDGGETTVNNHTAILGAIYLRTHFVSAGDNGCDVLYVTKAPHINSHKNAHTHFNNIK